MLAMILTPGCATSVIGVIDPASQLPAEAKVEREITPALKEAICDVLGGPIYWSANDTQETINEIEIKHNSQWVGFACVG